MTWVDGLVRPLIPAMYRPETYLPWKVPGTGLVVAFLAITLLGFLTANLVGRTLVEFGENLLDRMPVVRPIYRGLKQVFETLFSGRARASARSRWSSFRRPACGRWCFCRSRPAARSRYGCRARTSTCRRSCRARPTRRPGSSSTCRAATVIELDIPVEAAAKLIMTAGLIQPNGGGDTQKKLSAMAETARVAQAVRKAEPATTE